MEDRNADELRASVQERFGARSEGYRYSTVHAGGGDLERLIELVAPQPGELALDLATGAGHTALALARAGAAVTASDLTQAMLDESSDAFSSAGLRATFALEDACKLSFPDGAFDIVTTRMAPHHFPDPAAYVAEVSRVLRPGGRFALEDQCAPEDTDGARTTNAFEQRRDPSHNRQLPVSEWEGLVRGSGLEVASTEFFKKQLDFEWWTGLQNCGGDCQREISRLLAEGPQSARDWYEPAFREDGIVDNFCIPHMILLALKPA